MKPCEFAVYLHHFVGGEADGEVFPADKVYFELSKIDKFDPETHEPLPDAKTITYVNSGDEPQPCDSSGVEVIHCEDDVYKEAVFFKVRMVPKKGKVS